MINSDNELVPDTSQLEDDGETPYEANLRRKLEALSTAAQYLCLTVTNFHPMECACHVCQAACDALPYLPEMSPEYQKEFARRKAVQDLVKVMFPEKAE